MIKQVCDRCGKESSGGFWSTFKRTRMITQGEHDLCANCRDMLMRLIELLEEYFLKFKTVTIEGSDKTYE